MNSSNSRVVFYLYISPSHRFQFFTGNSPMRPQSRRNVSLIAFSVLVSLALTASARKSCEFPAIFNFGDSNSDTGGKAASFGQLGPPYGESYFGVPAGRYCDGRLIIDFIAESLGLPYLSPFLDALGSNFSHGANFASAGATIRPQNFTLEQSGFSPMHLGVQHTEFNDFRQRSQIIRQKGGVFADLMPKDEDFSQALYAIDIAQNDLSGAFGSKLTTDQIKATVPDLIDQLKAPIKDIYDQGGRSFWIHNTGPVGCSPAALETFVITAGQIDDVGCTIPYNEVAQFFNQKLKEAVVQLREELPEAALTYVDVYSIKLDLIKNAKKYGFEHPLTSCCGYGGKYNYSPNYGCGEKVKLHGMEVVVGSCEDPSALISWDGIHYTEAANKWISERIIDGSYSDPPIPLEMACHRVLEKSLLTPN